MKNEDKNKSKEPFRPEDTPRPPQVMDASRPPETSERESGEKAPEKNDEQPAKKEEGKKKLLGESPIEIDDETTI